MGDDLKKIKNIIDKLQTNEYQREYGLLINKYPKFKADIEYIFYEYGYEPESNGNKKNRSDDEFRHDVSKLYNGCCIVTGKNICIEIAHIKPFNKCNIDEKYDVANGIPLSRDIHGYYDNGYLKFIKINENQVKISFSKEFMENKTMTDDHKYNNKIITFKNKHSMKYI